MSQHNLLNSIHISLSGWIEWILRQEFYVVALVRHQVFDMSKYRQIQEIFNQLNHVPINPEGYCEKGKEHTLFMNLF